MNFVPSSLTKTYSNLLLHIGYIPAYYDISLRRAYLLPLKEVDSSMRQETQIGRIDYPVFLA